jgi:hypothetical protein
LVPHDGPRPLLLPRYSDKGAFKAKQWSGTPGQKGLIARALQALGLGSSSTAEEPAGATASAASSSSDADGGGVVGKAQKQSGKKTAAKGKKGTAPVEPTSSQGTAGGVLDPCPDPLPPWLVGQLGLLPWGAALAALHTPLNWEQYRAGQMRLAFQVSQACGPAVLQPKSMMHSKQQVVTVNCPAPVL